MGGQWWPCFSRGRFNMRKVLLATTAIVALGGVSAASADISVSGGFGFKYDSWSGANSTTANNNSITNASKFKISASTVADNGMTLSAYTFQDASETGAFNDAGASISDDWAQLVSGMPKRATRLQPQ